MLYHYNINQNDKIIYTRPEEHIADELARISCILRLAILRLNSFGNTEQQNTLPGVAYSPNGILQLLERLDINITGCTVSSEVKKFIEPIVKKQEELKGLISIRLSNSRKECKILPFALLKDILHLNDFEIDMLLLCLAPYIDARYEIIYGYIQDDLTKKYATLQMVFEVLTQSLEDRFEKEAYCSSHSSLFRWQVLKYGHDQAGQSVSPLFRPIYVDELVVNFLLGNSHRTLHCCTSLPGLCFHEVDGQSTKTLESLYLPSEIKAQLKNLLNRLIKEGKGVKGVFYFYGPSGSGKSDSAVSLSRELNKPILEVNIKALVYDEGNFSDNIRRILREALLSNSTLLIKNFDCILSDEDLKTSIRDRFIEEIEDQPVLIFLTGEKRWNDARSILSLSFSVQPYDLRKEIWEGVLRENNGGPALIESDELASKFRFTEGQIRDAAKIARKMAVFHSSENHGINHEDILIACRMQCHHKLSELAPKLEPRFTWSDIILPKDQMSQLHEIYDQFIYRNEVYDEWGFNNKTSRGRGLNILFSGSPGTGKTLAAEIMANALELEIYKIDLSQVVSKYIGETEKNLNRIFLEAESSNAILFFDEADALFGKRSEVKDAHDRYANIEIGYLLQKMEEYEGVTILATNLRQNLDDAFTRRIQFIVDFPFPDERYRYKIWQIHFPEQAPRSEDIDFEFLARQFKLAGGNIRNIVINASFLAVSESSKISMNHMIQATMREFQKMGKLCVKSDFDKYYDVIRRGQDE